MANLRYAALAAGVLVACDEGSKKALVDIGPKGRDAVELKNGDKITVEGEMTDAGEVRAAKIAVGDKPTFELPKARSWWQKMTGAGMHSGGGGI